MSGTIKLRVMVVDDEPLACQKVCDLLSADPEVEVLGSFTNGPEAIAAINEQNPDLVFLDVQMPELDGFSLLECLEPERLPYVVFVTAYDTYAVRAFEVNALDYLLKPFDGERFYASLERARTRISLEQGEGLGPRILAALEDIRSKPSYLERVVIKSSGHIFFLKTDEIDWLEAEGNYVRIHSGKESYLLRDTISGMQARLDPAKFLRVHRSAVVNIDRIQELQPWFHGEYRIILNDGIEIMLSRSYRDKLNQILGKGL